MYVQKIRKLWLIPFGAILLTACFNPVPTEKAPFLALTNTLITVGDISTSTPPPSINHIPENTVHPAPKKTVTVPNNSPTPSRTPPPANTPTITPYPTLAPDEMQAFLINKMKNNEDCDLPCWWGITPGETKWDSVKQNFETAGIEVREDGKLGLWSVQEDTPGYRYVTDMMNVVFSQDEGIVQSINIQNSREYTPLQGIYSSLWVSYSVQSILETNGVPSSILLNLSTGVPSASAGFLADYDMWLVYDNEGFAVSYAGLLIPDNVYWHICPKSGMIKDIEIRIQTGDSPGFLVDFDTEVYDLSGYFSIYGELNEISGMRSQTFYDVFSKSHPQKCIDIPKQEIEGYRLLTSPTPPKITTQAEDALLRDLLKHNAGCELPCWWGITPGKTHTTDALSLFSTYGRSIATWDWEVDKWGKGYEMSLFGMHDPQPYDYSVKNILYSKNQIVNVLGVQAHTVGWPAEIVNPPQHFTEDWHQYLPSSILARFGAPDEILVHYWFEMIAPYSVAMLYPEHGLVIEYMGITKGTKDTDTYGYNHLELCAGNQLFSDINLWITALEDSDRANLVDILEDFGGGYVQPTHFNTAPNLLEATGISIEQFTQMFLEPDAKFCFSADPQLGDRVP